MIQVQHASYDYMMKEKNNSAEKAGPVSSSEPILHSAIHRRSASSTTAAPNLHKGKQFAKLHQSRHKAGQTKIQRP